MFRNFSQVLLTNFLKKQNKTKMRIDPYFSAEYPTKMLSAPGVPGIHGERDR